MESRAKSVHEKQKYLIDSDVLINHIHKRRDTLVKLIEKDNITVSSSVLNKIELYRGARNEKDKTIIDDLMRYFYIYEVDELVADKVYELCALNKLGSLGPMDLMIAATCLVNNLVLVTHNLKHFSLVPDIKIYKE